MNFKILNMSLRRPRRGKARLAPKIAILALFLFLPNLVFATPQVPRTIVFQGILTDDGGNPLTDVSSAEASISIVDGAGTLRYEELQTITLYQGATAFLVGMGVSPDTGEPTGGIPLDMVEPGEGDLILKIKLAGQSIAQENIVLASVPFSFYSQYAVELTQPIESDQIKDGTITIEDISEEALNTIKEGELTKEDLEAHKTEKSAHAATSISVDNTFRYLTGTNLQTLMESTDYTLTLAIKAAQTIDSGDIQDGSIGINDLDMSQFSGWDTNASDDLTTSTIFQGALTGAYNSLELGDNTVQSSTIVDGSIQSIDLADGSVTASKLAESYLSTEGGTITGDLNIGGDETVEGDLEIKGNLTVTGYANNPFDPDETEVITVDVWPKIKNIYYENNILVIPSDPSTISECISLGDSVYACYLTVECNSQDHILGCSGLYSGACYGSTTICSFQGAISSEDIFSSKCTSVVTVRNMTIDTKLYTYAICGETYK